jgi:hypothetical protein
MRIEHPERHALVASLVRIVTPKAFAIVCARPCPRMRRTAQRQKKSAQTLHNLRTPVLVRARILAQDLLAEFGIDGEKLSCCQCEPSIRSAQVVLAQLFHVQSRLRTSNFNVVGSYLSCNSAERFGN